MYFNSIYSINITATNSYGEYLSVFPYKVSTGKYYSTLYAYSQSTLEMRTRRICWSVCCSKRRTWIWISSLLNNDNVFLRYNFSTLLFVNVFSTKLSPLVQTSLALVSIGVDVLSDAISERYYQIFIRSCRTSIVFFLCNSWWDVVLLILCSIRYNYYTK